MIFAKHYGGCVITGKVWDWQINPFYNSDIFFLKLDKNGNITASQGINEIITQSEILVYPNPASEIINFISVCIKIFSYWYIINWGKLFWKTN